MKCLIILILILSLLCPLFADERETVFEGLDAEIVSIVDDMTDKKSGVVYLDFNCIYLAVTGHNCFMIYPNRGDPHFALDGNHLIRIGKNEPFSLTAVNKKNCLIPSNTTEAESVIKSLLRGEEVKIRYFNWPQYDKIDIKVSNPNFSFIYNKAALLFGWKNIDIKTKPIPAKLSIYIPTDTYKKGYARVTVNGNSDLGLGKGFDEFGGGSTIEVGVKNTFGLHKGRWICKSVELEGGKYLIIRNSENEIVFKEELPKRYDIPITGATWPAGERAALAAWESAPFGSIEVEGFLGKRVLLYGFKELWKWGVENAGFPELE